MTPRQTVLVAVVTTGLIGVVLLFFDWSATALQDPARTLGLLSPQGVVRLGESPDRAPFTPFEVLMYLAVGLAFVAAGVAVGQHRPGQNPGMLLIVAGWLWLVAGLRRSSDPTAFTLGVILTLMYQPPLLQLALSFPSGVLRTRAEKRIVAFFFGVWLAVAVASWAFFDPRLHVAAGESTSRNLLLLWDSPELTDAIGHAARILQMGVGVVIMTVLVNHWRSGTRAYRASFLLLWLAVLIKAGATIWVGLAVVQLSGSLSSEALLWQYPATAIVPLAVLLGLWRYRFARGDLGDLMVEIGAAPVGERLRDALRKSVRDPTLSLWQWSPERNSFVDASGAARHLPEGKAGRADMVLEHNGAPVGALVFDAALRDQPRLLEAVRSAASLTLHNQNVEQQLREQLGEVRRSRERIVTAGDSRRRQLERDLHDGAQQRLVAVTMELARARRAAESQEVRGLIEQASAELAAALGELRNLARGVYPPSLQERGLEGALTALAERACIPVELDISLSRRPPPPVELAAYFICLEAVTNTGKHAHASSARIRVAGTDSQLTLVVTDNGRGGARQGVDGGLLGLADRAAALGGSLSVSSPEGGGTTIAAGLPYSTAVGRD